MLGSKGFGAKDFGSEQCLVFVKFLGLKGFGVKRFGVKICCWHPHVRLGYPSLESKSQSAKSSSNSQLAQITGGVVSVSLPVAPPASTFAGQSTFATSQPVAPYSSLSMLLVACMSKPIGDRRRGSGQDSKKETIKI